MESVLKIIMRYLKTIISSPAEINFVKLNLKESFEHIDKFVICEFNRTHVGTERKLIFNNYLDAFSKEEKSKIIYIGADIVSQVKLAQDNVNIAHENEKLMRGYFAKKMDLNDKDIVFSVDADEIIFADHYQKIVDELSFFTPAIKLRLHQFFYRINYLWVNKKFIAPTVCYAKYYKRKYPGQWRYDGRLYREIAGCHFSWCLSIEEMIQKLNMYAHKNEYGHLAHKEILQNAVDSKIYPFDPSIDLDRKSVV